MNEEALQQILDATKKEARFTRIIAILMAVMLAAMLITLLLVVPRAIRVINKINTAVTKAQEIMEQGEEVLTGVETSLEGVDTMTESIGKLGDEALKGISEVDFETLSQAITDLQAAVEPLAKFSRALGGGR